MHIFTLQGEVTAAGSSLQGICTHQINSWAVRAGGSSNKQSGSPHSTHLHSPLHQHRSFGTDTEEAEKIQYPVTTPDHVFVYKGPLALTVSRLKVTKFAYGYAIDTILIQTCNC